MNLLMSYFYFDDPALYAELRGMGMRLLADSGAFSAYSLDKPIDIDEFAEFAHEVSSHVEGVFTLDAIGDPAQSHRNHEWLRSKGLRPIPVWQSHDPSWDGFEDFIEDEEWVALGSLVKNPKMKQPAGYNERRITSFMRRVGDRKTHLLGYARESHIAAIRPTTCDSSSQQASLRFGAALKIYNRSGTKLVTRIEDYNEGPTTTAQMDAIRAILPDFNFANWKYERHVLSFATHLLRYAAVEMAVGTHIYSAISVKQRLDNYIEAYERTKPLREKIRCSTITHSSS